MSQSTDKTSCISHRQNIRFFVMYEDFLDVARVSEEHQYKLAAFWRVLETKTNDQIIYNTKLIENARTQGLPEPETTLWIEIPYSEFVNRSLGVYKSSSFQFASAESERLGFSKCRVLKRPRNPRDPNSPLEEYKEYLFLTEAMQTVLTSGVYPTPIENNSPLLKSYNERKAKRAIKNNTTPIENNTGSAIENNSPPIEINNNKYITSITDKNTEVIESSDDVAIANHHASSPTLPESGTIQGHHQGSEQSPEIVHAPSFSTDPDVKGDVSPTQDSGFLPSVQSENASVPTNTSIGVSQSSQAISASPQSEKTALSTHEQSNQASYSREHAHETPDTVVPEKPPRPSRTNKPPVEKPAPPDPTAEEIAAQEAVEVMNKRCGAWQGRINKWRGYELEKRGAIINERSCIRKLCEKYTDIQIKRVYTYLFKDDWKWSKPDNRYKIGANEVLEEAGRVIQQLSGKSVPPTDDDIPDNVTPIDRRSSITESSTDLRVMAAKAREMAAAQGGK